MTRPNRIEISSGLIAFFDGAIGFLSGYEPALVPDAWGADDLLARHIERFTRLPDGAIERIRFVGERRKIRRVA